MYPSHCGIITFAFMHFFQTHTFFTDMEAEMAFHERKSMKQPFVTLANTGQTQQCNGNTAQTQQCNANTAQTQHCNANTAQTQQCNANTGQTQQCNANTAQTQQCNGNTGQTQII
jgi:hypothetical protein